MVWGKERGLTKRLEIEPKTGNGKSENEERGTGNGIRGTGFGEREISKRGISKNRESLKGGISLKRGISNWGESLKREISKTGESLKRGNL